MKKRIVLYCRRNVGVIALTYLVAKGHDVLVISDDHMVFLVADELGVGKSELELIPTLDFDLFLCVHGNKILPESYLREGKMVNIHPCLYKYPGANPIKKYIKNGDELGSVESHYMTDEVDKGEVIYRQDFATGKCNTFADFYNVALPMYIFTIQRTLNKIFE